MPEERNPKIRQSTTPRVERGGLPLHSTLFLAPLIRTTIPFLAENNPWVAFRNWSLLIVPKFPSPLCADRGGKPGKFLLIEHIRLWIFSCQRFVGPPTRSFLTLSSGPFQQNQKQTCLRCPASVWTPWPGDEAQPLVLVMARSDATSVAPSAASR